jgi:hypothetical protein
LLALNGVATASFVAALSASRRYTAGALMLLERYGQRELERLLKSLNLSTEWIQESHEDVVYGGAHGGES